MQPFGSKYNAGKALYRLPAPSGSSNSGNPPTAGAGLPRWLGDNPPANAEDASSVPGVRRSPGLGNDNYSVFLPGKSHGQRSLVGCSPLDRKRVRHDLATKQQQQHQPASPKIVGNKQEAMG